MTSAIFGTKKRMTQAFTDAGRLVGVTVIEVEPNVVTEVRTSEKHGYEAVQVGFGRAANKTSKPHAGVFARHDAPPRRHLRELRGVSGEAGQTLGLDQFEAGDHVHVSARSKGKGFQGTIKRHNFSRGPETHGSHNVRPPGSVGQAADPSRIFPGRKMPGQMGNAEVTVRNLEVVAVDAEAGEIWIRGGVPGPRGGVVVIRKEGDRVG